MMTGGLPKWSYTNATVYSKFSRGYTGHEHLDNFGLINMNGRMYDPNLGRFLSPDPLLQNPSSMQGHNRYSYALNNPLKYTDPSGYNVKPAFCYKGYMYGGSNVNFGRHGGSLSDSYWANDYRSAEANWSVMSGNQFDNIYGDGKYNNTFQLIKLDYALRNLTSEDEIFTYDLNSGLNLYMVNNNGNISFFSSNGIVTHYSVGTDNGLTFYNQNGETAGATRLETTEITYKVQIGQQNDIFDTGLDYADNTNNAIDAFSKTLGTNGLTALMVKAGKSIGRYSGPAGIIINTGQVFNGVRKDGYTYGHNAKQATAGAVGGIAGAWAGFQAGAWAGFEVGFTVGLAFEGIGAIPGAVIGGVVGGFIGAWGGAYGGSKLGESLINN